MYAKGIEFERIFEENNYLDLDYCAMLGQRRVVLQDVVVKRPQSIPLRRVQQNMRSFALHMRDRFLRRPGISLN